MQNVGHFSQKYLLLERVQYAGGNAKKECHVMFYLELFRKLYRDGRNVNLYSQDQADLRCNRRARKERGSRSAGTSAQVCRLAR